MMKKIFAPLIFLTTLCLLGNIPVLQAAKLVESSSKKMPSWAGKTTEDKNKFYFSGSATNQKYFETARKMAVSDALTQIAESLDITITSSSQKLITDTAAYLEDKTSSKSRDIKVLNTKIKDIYYEKYDDTGDISYNVFVQIEYGKKEYEAEKQRLAKEYDGIKQNIANLCTKADSLLENSSRMEALKSYFEALKIIYEYGTCRDKETEIVAKINGLLSEISFRISYKEADTDNDITIISDAYFDQTDESPSKAWFSFKSRGMELASLQADDEGGIACNGFGSISFLKKSLYEFELDLKKTFNLSDDFCEAYSFRNVSVAVDLLGSHKKIAIAVKADGALKDIDDFKDIIKNELSKNGLTVVKKNEPCNLILNINIKFIDTTQSKLRNIQSTDMDLYLSNAAVTAELVSTARNKIIGAASSDIKGFGRTVSKSYIDLMNRIAYFITTAL